MALSSLSWLQSDPEHIIYSDASSNIMCLDRLSSQCTEMQLAKYNRFKAGHPAGFIEAFANYYADIYSSILNTRSKSVANFFTAYNGLKLCSALNCSSQSNTLVSINQI